MSLKSTKYIDFYEVLSEAEVIWIGNYHEDMDNLMSFDTVVKIGTKFIKFTKYQELSEGYLCWVFNYDSVEEVIQYKEWEKVIKYSTPSEYENYIKKVKNK